MAGGAGTSVTVPGRGPQPRGRLCLSPSPGSSVLLSEAKVAEASTKSGAQPAAGRHHCG